MLSAAGEPAALVEARCPTCGPSKAAQILTITDAPVTVATVYPDAASATTAPRGTIDLVCCTHCGILFNRAFDLGLALAGALYESSQASSAHFGGYIQSLARDWVERYALRGKRVVEVGCGDADFMVALLRAGAGSALGIDPLARMPEGAEEFADRLEFDAADFAERHLGVAGAALVCRHTIEHIPDVVGFLRLVGEWSRRHGGAPVLFEAPATERIVHEGAFWDLYYEHCNYFSRQALETAFQAAGLAVEQCDLAYGEQYILLAARAAPGGRMPAVEQDWLQDCRHFGERASMAVASCRARMQEFGGTAGGMVIWQGAAKTVGLVTSLGGDVPVRFAVDLNSRRHGLYLPPFGLQVRDPADIADSAASHVVLMNPVYFDEVRRRLDAMGCNGIMLHTVDSLIDG